MIQITRHRKLALWGVPLVLLAGILAGVLVSYQTKSASAQSADPEQIADQFFPQELAQEATERESRGGSPFVRKLCFTVYDRLPDGNPKTIVAGYTDGIGGAIRVIQAQASGGYGVVFEPSQFTFGDSGCDVNLVDLDGDASNEVKVSFVTYWGRAQADWYFRWDGLQLINLGPTHGDPPATFTSFSDTDTLDLDHDGVLEIISVADARLVPDEEGFVPGPVRKVYKNSGGVYVLDRPLVYIGFFLRKAREPVTDERALNLPAEPIGTYALKVINGKADGSRRVSSARIVLNGVEILSPNNFSQQVEFLTIPVTLVRHNIIEVTLAGTPLGEIILTIEDTSAQQGSGQ